MHAGPEYEVSKLNPPLAKAEGAVGVICNEYNNDIEGGTDLGEGGAPCHIMGNTLFE